MPSENGSGRSGLRPTLITLLGVGVAQQIESGVDAERASAAENHVRLHSESQSMIVQ